MTITPFIKNLAPRTFARTIWGVLDDELIPVTPRDRVRKGIEIVLGLLLFGFFALRGLKQQSMGAAIAYSALGLGGYYALIVVTRVLLKPPQK